VLAQAGLVEWIRVTPAWLEFAGRILR